MKSVNTSSQVQFPQNIPLESIELMQKALIDCLQTALIHPDVLLNQDTIFYAVELISLLSQRNPNLTYGA
jgi:hypothetical protein